MTTRRRCFAAFAVVLSTPLVQSVTAQSLATITGRVTNAETNVPLSGVAVRVVGAQQVAVTRADGAYRLQLKHGRYELRAAQLGFAPVTHSVTVMVDQTTVQDFALAPSAVPLDEVVTIGTRRVDRTVTQSPLPVDVIPETALETTGFVETWQALQRLVPSLNVPHIPLGDDHLRPITLRGLSPNQVLVLVNGKRRHSAAVLQGGPVLNGSTPVDINTIPTSAIDRIEVLRDGAAAQYGSDAIAGVVNIVLKSGERREARTSFGQVFSSEGGRDFRDGRVVDVNATYGALLPRGAHMAVNAELRRHASTNRAYPDLREQYLTGDPRNNNPPRISSHEGDGEARDVGFLINGGIPLRMGIEFYGFGGATQRNGSAQSAFFRRANDVRTVRAIHPDGFLSEIGTGVLDYSATAGARGSARSWRWDLSSAFGGNSVRYDVHNSNNVSLGTSSPTDFFAGKLDARQWTSNLDLSRELNVGLPEPINVGTGLEFRIDRYRIRAGEPDSYRDGGAPILGGDSAGKPSAIGSQGMLGFRPGDEVDASRNSLGAYVDLESHIARRMLLNVAGRVERYSDFGSTSNGKIAARFELLRGVAIRGAASTGFRAPSLTQSYFSTTRGILRLVNGVNTTFIIRTMPVNTPEAQVLGAKPLRPETSLNLSSGIVVDIPHLPTLTADYYAIDIDDRIVGSGELVGPAVTLLFEQHGLRGIAGGSYFTNAIDTRTRGIDLVATQGLLLGTAGRVQWTGGFNQTSTRVTRVAETPPELTSFQSVLFNRAERGKFEVGQPRRTIVLTTNYWVRNVNVTLHNQRFGQALLLDNKDPVNDQTVKAKWITDLGVSYQLRRYTLAANANNLFDVYPDEWNDFKLGVQALGMSNRGIFRYPGGISPFGMNGRTVYVHVSYR